MRRCAVLLYLAVLAALLFAVPLLFAERAHGLTTGELPHVCTTITSTLIDTATPTQVTTAAPITLTNLPGVATDVVAFADWNITATGGTAQRYYTCTLRPTSTTGCGTPAQCGAPASCLSAVTDAQLEHSTCDYAHGQLLQQGELLGGATVGFAQDVTSTTQTWGLYCELNVATTKSITIDGGTVCAIGFRSWDALVDVGTNGIFRTWTGDTTLSSTYGTVGDLSSLSLTVPTTTGANVLLIGGVAVRPSSGAGSRQINARIVEGASTVLLQPVAFEQGTGGLSSGLVYGVKFLGSGCSGGGCTFSLKLEAKTDGTASVARKGVLIAIPMGSTTTGYYQATGSDAATATGSLPLALEPTPTTLLNHNQPNFPSAAQPGPLAVFGSASFYPNATGSAARGWHARLHECSNCTTAPTDANKLGGRFDGYAITQAESTRRQLAMFRIKTNETANPSHRVDLTGSSASSANPVDADQPSLGSFALVPDPSSLPPTPTPLPTNTTTRTPTGTHTPTVTLTPTPAPGCYIVTVTPAASADDVLLRSTNNGAAALTSNGTTISFGVFEAFGIDFEDVAALRFNTAPLIPDTATVTAAWLQLYGATTTASSGGTRHFIGKWTGNQGAWATSDFEDEVTPADAFDFAFPADLSTGRYYTINLSNPSNVDKDTGYTGLKLGATNPSAPTASDGIVWTFQSQDGTNKPVLAIAYCDATPTPANTATVTQTPTRTPNAPHYSIPDMNGDGRRAIAVNMVDEKLVGIMDNLAATLAIGDPDTICSRSMTGQPSAALYAQQLALTQAAQPGRCSVQGVTGTLWRGTNDFIDVEIIDTCPVTDAMLTWTAPDPEIAGAGLCCTAAGCSGTCRVNHRQGGIALGLNTLCAEGPSFGSSCRRVDPAGLLTPTPCIDDPAPSDETGIASSCKDNLYSVADGADVTDCTGLCWEQTREAATRWNVREAIRQAELRGAAVVLTCGPLQANWLHPELAADVTPVITPMPNGTPAPTQRVRAPWEPAYRSHAYGRANLRPMARTLPEGYPERSWIDFAMLAGDATASQPWKFLGNSKTLATLGAGHCTCLVDSDCGAGGTCEGGLYCSAGTRNTCVKDSDCRGSNSQAKPGTAYCLRRADQIAAEAVQACLERWQMDRDPSLFHKGVLDCGGLPESDDRTPFGTQTPTRTITPTVTLTVAVPPTATATDTAGPAPTATATATATNTSAVPLLPQATIPYGHPCMKKTGKNGRLADIFGADMRRSISEYSKCFNADFFPLLSPVCDPNTGPSGWPNVPTDITYALTIPNNAQVNREVGRCGFHVVEDKLRASNCDDPGPGGEPYYYLYLMWDWVRHRAYSLGMSVPALETIDVHTGANGAWAWDAWYKMVERYYVRPLQIQMRADLAGSIAAVDQICAGHIMNQMGYLLLDDWVTRGKDKCWEAGSTAGVTNNCSPVHIPTVATIRGWCDGYKTIIQPLWEGVRAGEGKECRTGRCSTTSTIWCGGVEFCPGAETCDFTAAVACP